MSQVILTRSSSAGFCESCGTELPSGSLARCGFCGRHGYGV